MGVGSMSREAERDEQGTAMTEDHDEEPRAVKQLSTAAGPVRENARFGRACR